MWREINFSLLFFYLNSMKQYASSRWTNIWKFICNQHIRGEKNNTQFKERKYCSYVYGFLCIFIWTQFIVLLFSKNLKHSGFGFWIFYSKYQVTCNFFFRCRIKTVESKKKDIKEKMKFKKTNKKFLNLLLIFFN